MPMIDMGTSMTMDSGMWRAVALGYAVGFITLLYVGELNWITPAAATLAAMAAVIIWRD